MVSDFIKDLRTTDGEEFLTEGVICDFRIFIGIEPFEISVESNRLLSARTVKKRLEPLVLELLGLEEHDKRRSEESRRANTIVRQRYGIGTRSLSVATIAKKYGLSEYRVKRIIRDKLDEWQCSDKYCSWPYFLALGTYLKKADFDRLCAVVRNDKEAQKHYKDLRLLSKCLKNAGLPRR